MRLEPCPISAPPGAHCTQVVDRLSNTRKGETGTYRDAGSSPYTRTVRLGAVLAEKEPDGANVAESRCEPVASEVVVMLATPEALTAALPN